MLNRLGVADWPSQTKPQRSKHSRHQDGPRYDPQVPAFSNFLFIDRRGELERPRKSRSEYS